MSASRHHLGFESDDQLKAFIKALSKSAVPGKFAYVGEAATTYDIHALTNEYSQVTRSVADESSLLSEVLGNEFDSIRTLADVGPGNGLHSGALLRRLSAEANWTPDEYLAVDYSSRMADLAMENIKQLVRKIHVNSFIFDIESEFTQGSCYLPSSFESVYFLLGNTIGNVESIPRAINGIRSLAGNGARLLIGCALFGEHRSEESYLRPYRMETYIDCVLRPFAMIGVPRPLMEFAVEFDPNLRVISTLVRFKEDLKIDVLGESVEMKAGSTIRCALSRRFLPGEIPNLFRQWDIPVLGMVEDVPNGHGTYCAVI
ncbi:MAG TPA: L-histidine N(alpha)-methyltransferase [Trebonia sp.]|nr:L-histidine N(alpha)-methyltransferase [Trebonia sp.]